MINFLRAYGGWLLVGFLVLMTGFMLGETVTKARLTPQITAAERALSDAQMAFVQAQKNAADLNNQALREANAKQQALTAFNEQLSADLYATNRELALAQQQHDRSIPDALNHDGQTYTGLGPDSLRLYTAALGYRTRSSDNRLPAPTAGHDATPLKAPTPYVGDTRGAIETRNSLRDVEPGTGEPINRHPPLAGNELRTK